MAMDAMWLKSQLEQPGRSQAALARFLHVDQSAVNRMCNGTREIKAREADQIQAYLRGTSRGAQDSDGFGEEAADFEGGPTVVEGVVEAGTWRDSSARPAGPRTIPVISSSPIKGEVFALRVAGPSMNKTYQDGSYVIVRRWNGGPLPFGRDVIVQRTRPDGLYETTIKELRPAGDYPELWPRSTDSAHQQPVKYDEGADIVVEIIGLVIGAWRVIDSAA